MNKGTKSPLFYTQEKRHRILAGLSWDAREDNVSIIDQVQGDSQHDLDISAYIYDFDNDFIDIVSPVAVENIDESGAVYHSGDHQTGEGDGDDEAISIELLNLPDETKAIFFLIEAQSNHFIGDMASVSMRIADGMTNQNILDKTIYDEEANSSIAYIFSALIADDDSPTGWSIHFIDEYPNIEDIKEWGEYFKRYLIQ